jgi:hypothetical protein
MLQLAERRKHWLRLGIYSAAVLIAAVLFLLWQGGLKAVLVSIPVGVMTPEIEAAVAVGVAVGVALAVTVWIGVPVTVWVAVAVGILAGVAAGFAVGISAGVAARGMAGGAGMIMVVGAGMYLYDRLINQPRATSEEALNGLVEMEASSHPAQCIAYMEWVDSDETIRHYQHQLASIGRKPVMAEYELFKAWVKDARNRQSEQEKIEQARLACARMGVSIWPQSSG